MLYLIMILNSMSPGGDNNIPCLTERPLPTRTSRDTIRTSRDTIRTSRDTISACKNKLEFLKASRVDIKGQYKKLFNTHKELRDSIQYNENELETLPRVYTLYPVLQTRANKNVSNISDEMLLYTNAGQKTPENQERLRELEIRLAEAQTRREDFETAVAQDRDAYNMLEEETKGLRESLTAIAAEMKNLKEKYRAIKKDIPTLEQYIKKSEFFNTPVFDVSGISWGIYTEFERKIYGSPRKDKI